MTQIFIAFEQSFPKVKLSRKGSKDKMDYSYSWLEKE